MLQVLGMDKAGERKSTGSLVPYLRAQLNTSVRARMRRANYPDHLTSVKRQRNRGALEAGAVGITSGFGIPGFSCRRNQPHHLSDGEKSKSDLQVSLGRQ